MSEEIVPYQEPVKAYTVFNVDTNRVIYKGNSLLKTIEALFSGQPTSVTFANPIHATILKHAVALQSRLN